MSQNQNKVLKRRIAGAYLGSVVSIALVLFVVGIVALLLLNAGSVADYFKENVRVTVLLRQGVSENQGKALLESVKRIGFVKDARYVGIDEGTRELEAILGEDFVSVFSSSPVPTSIEVTLHPQYVHPDSLGKVCARLGESRLVEEVNCRQSLVESLNQSIGKISTLLGGFTLILLFISIILISNTIRLVIYADRVSIHTMKLVGASTSFILGPYLTKAFFQAMFSSIIASIGLMGLLFALKSSFPGMFSLLSVEILLGSLGLMFLVGILICILSTLVLVKKYINIPKNELYA